MNKYAILLGIDYILAQSILLIKRLTHLST
jgi:hypothetical protein